MTHTRHDRTGLADSEPRCEPSDHCPMLARCTRYHAALPAQGATLVDYSIQSCGGTAICPGYMPAERLPNAAKAAPAVKPWPVAE